MLEPEAPLASLAGSCLEHEVRGDELVHGVAKALPARLAQDAVAEALPDHRRDLYAFARRRWQPVDARRHDRVQRRGHLEHRGSIAQPPLAHFVALHRARLDQRPQRLLDEEGIAAGPSDDAVAELGRHPVKGRLDDARRFFIGERLEHELREVRA